MVDRYVKPSGYGATVRVILLEFKKAFDLINHQIWISTYDIPKDVIFWITDFLTSRKQRQLLFGMTRSPGGVFPMALLLL